MHVDVFTPKTWSDILFGMLDEQSVWMGKTIQLLANCNGGVIFNCNSGRNRSNLMALIILAIAKVPLKILLRSIQQMHIIYKRHILSGILKDRIHQAFMKRHLLLWKM